MAVSQSNIQSLLQDLTGVHTGGQSWVPNSGVSGNPNTAYNNAPPMSGNDPAQQMGSPSMSTGGNLPPQVVGPNPQTQTGVPWAVPKTPNGQVDWSQLSGQPASNAVPGGFKGFPNILQGAGVGWKPDAVGIGTPTPPPPGSPPPVPPGGTPPPNVHPTTGGPDPANQWGGGDGRFNGPNDPIFNDRSKLTNGGGLDLLGVPSEFRGDLYSGSQQGAGQGGVSSRDFMAAFGQLGNMSMNLGSAGKSLGSTALGRALGVTPDGTVDVMQILDLFIPGNVWMGETHQTNLMNMIPALAGKINPLLGIAVSKVMDYFGAKYANEDDSKLGTGLLGKIRRAVRNRYMKNQANKAAGHGGPGANAGGGMGGDHSGGGFGGSWLDGGGVGGFTSGGSSGGGQWVDSSGNPVDPGSFGSYWVDPQNPNNAYSGGTFANGGTHPGGGQGRGGEGGGGGAGGGYGGSSNGSSGSSGGSSRGTGGNMSNRNKLNLKQL